MYSLRKQYRPDEYIVKRFNKYRVFGRDRLFNKPEIRMGENIRRFRFQYRVFSDSTSACSLPLVSHT